MIYSILGQLLGLLVDLFALLRWSDHAKDLEILALRQQLYQGVTQRASVAHLK